MVGEDWKGGSWIVIRCLARLDVPFEHFLESHAATIHSPFNHDHGLCLPLSFRLERSMGDDFAVNLGSGPKSSKSTLALSLSPYKLGIRVHRLAHNQPWIMLLLLCHGAIDKGGCLSCKQSVPPWKWVKCERGNTPHFWAPNPQDQIFNAWFKRIVRDSTAVYLSH